MISIIKCVISIDSLRVHSCGYHYYGINNIFNKLIIVKWVFRNYIVVVKDILEVFRLNVYLNCLYITHIDITHSLGDLPPILALIL